MVTCLAYCLDKELWKAIEYLREQVKVLKEEQEREKRILLNNHQRVRFAAKAKQLTRRLFRLPTHGFPAWQTNGLSIEWHEDKP
jgi:hypothetical protein